MPFKLARVAAFLITFVSLAAFAGSLKLPSSWAFRGVCLIVALVGFVAWNVIHARYARHNTPQMETGVLARALKYGLIALGCTSLILPMASALTSLFLANVSGIPFSVKDFTIDLLESHGNHLAAALAFFVPATMIKTSKSEPTPAKRTTHDRIDPTFGADRDDIDI